MYRVKAVALLCAAITLLSAACSSGGAPQGIDFSIPAGFASDPDLLPSSWIARYEIDPATELTPEQVRQLDALFIAAHEWSKKKLRQDYMIRTDVKLYQLLKRYHPGLESLPAEGDSIFLGDIAVALQGSSRAP